MPNLQLQIYDKWREEAARKKTYWFKVWKTDTQDKTQQVWHIEVRAGKKHLKDRWRIITFQDLENSFSDVVVPPLRPKSERNAYLILSNIQIGGGTLMKSSPKSKAKSITIDSA